MKAFVTGASGFFGGNLVRELIKQDWEVSILLRKGSWSPALNGLPLKTLYGDIFDKEILASGMNGCNLVYHAAASVGTYNYPDGRMANINIEGTKSVAEAAVLAGVNRFIQISTVDTIGFATSDGWGTLEKPSTEDIPGPNSWTGNDYMITKWKAQQEALEIGRKNNMDVVVLNPAFMLGPYDPKPSSGTMLLSLYKGEILGYTSGGNNFIHVKDACEAAVAAADKGRPGNLYILGNENLTYKNFFKLAADIMGKRPPGFMIPKPVALAAGMLGSTAGKIFGRWGFNPVRLNINSAKMGYIPHYYDPSKARKELGLKSTPISKAVDDAFRWFKDNNYI